MPTTRSSFLFCDRAIGKRLPQVGYLESTALICAAIRFPKINTAICLTLCMARGLKPPRLRRAALNLALSRTRYRRPNLRTLNQYAFSTLLSMKSPHPVMTGRAAAHYIVFHFSYRDARHRSGPRCLSSSGTIHLDSHRYTDRESLPSPG